MCSAAQVTEIPIKLRCFLNKAVITNPAKAKIAPVAEKAKDVTETRNGEKKVIGITQSVTITGMKDNLDKKLKLV